MSAYKECAIGIAVAPTLSDSTDLPRSAVGFILCAAGAIKITDFEGNASTIPTGLAVGVPIPIRVRRIWSTGTTVANTNIVLLFNKY